MASPFPGMNPFLEQSDTWEDFHQDYMTRAREVLTGEVGPNYLVKIETRLYLHELSAEERRFMGRADVGITGPPPGAKQSAAGILAPASLAMPSIDVERHSSLEIRDRRNRR